jgi:hypothetical protein
MNMTTGGATQVSLPTYEQIWGAENAPSGNDIDTDIQNFLDEGNEFKFSYQGQEYTIKKEGDQYVCRDANGDVVDPDVQINNSDTVDGFLEIRGLPQSGGDALYIGNKPGENGEIIFFHGSHELDSGAASDLLTGPADKKIAIQTISTSDDETPPSDGDVADPQQDAIDMGFVDESGKLTELGIKAKEQGLIDENGVLTDAGRAVSAIVPDSDLPLTSETLGDVLEKAVDNGLIQELTGENDAISYAATDLGLAVGKAGGFDAAIEAGLLDSSNKLTPYGEIVVADMRTTENSAAVMHDLGFTDDQGVLTDLGEEAQAAGLIDENGHLTQAGKAFVASLPDQTKLDSTTFLDALDNAENNGFLQASDDGLSYVATDFGMIVGAAGSIDAAKENGWLDSSNALSVDAQKFVDEIRNEELMISLGFTNQDGSLTEVGLAAQEAGLIDEQGNLTSEGKIVSYLAQRDGDAGPIESEEDLNALISKAVDEKLIEGDETSGYSATDLGIVVGEAGGYDQAVANDWIENTPEGWVVTDAGQKIVDEVTTVSATEDSDLEALGFLDDAGKLTTDGQAALDNNLLVKNADGTYSLTLEGKAFEYAFKTGNADSQSYEDVLAYAVTQGLINVPTSGETAYSVTDLGILVGEAVGFGHAQDKGWIEQNTDGSWDITDAGKEYVEDVRAGTV